MNDAPTIGDNRPPSDIEILHDRLAEAHRDLLRRRDELLAAAARAPEQIDNDEQAGRVGDFIKQLAAVTKAADAKRVAEKEPHLAAGRAVDGFFKAIAEPIEGAKRIIEARLTAYLRRKADEERRRREEAERVAREEAASLAREAAAKAAAMKRESDLQAALDAERAAGVAKVAAIAATRAAEAKPADMARARGDHGAVSSLRRSWEFEITDRASVDLAALRPFIDLDAAIRAFVRSGGRELRGVRIYEATHAVVR